MRVRAAVATSCLVLLGCVPDVDLSVLEELPMASDGRGTGVGETTAGGPDGDSTGPGALSDTSSSAADGDSTTTADGSTSADGSTTADGSTGSTTNEGSTTDGGSTTGGSEGSDGSGGSGGSGIPGDGEYGTPCSDDADCDGGYCYVPGTGVNPVCSELCTTDDDCERGARCIEFFPDSYCFWSCEDDAFCQAINDNQDNPLVCLDFYDVCAPQSEP